MPTPYIALYPTDFLADVGHLGNTELGIYWRLLLVYYRDGKPLPFDTDRLRRLAMTFSPEEGRALDSVVAEFFVLSTEPDGTRCWRHKRADREMSTATVKHEKASAKAAKAAEAMWAKRKGDAPSMLQAEKHAPSMPEAMPEACQPEPEPEPQLIQPPLPSVVAPLPEKPAPKAKAKPAPKVEKPDGVDQQVWDDWLALRRARKAPVTKTVLDGAVDEAEKASLTLEAFLRVWCVRGSQGLQADWLKPHERGGQSSAEPAWRTEQRERAKAFAPYAYAKPETARAAKPTGEVIENEPTAH